MFSLTQLDVPGHRRQWMLMDMVTCLPLLYPLRYCVDHLGFRSLSTQSASLQAIKFFYEFWLQKHSVTFCHSFNVSMHNPQIAIEEMTAFFHYLESGRSTPSGVIALPLSVTASRTTNALRARAVIRFIEFLISTYISPVYQSGSPKELSLMSARLRIRLTICKDEYRSLSSRRKSGRGQASHQGFQSMASEMVRSVYQIITPVSSKQPSKLNPFPSGNIQLRNFLIIRLLLNYGLRVSELLLLECKSIKPNLKGDKFSLIVTIADDASDPRKRPPALKNAYAHRILELDKHDYEFLKIYRAINRAILRLSPSAYQAAVASGEAASVIITPTDLRHNVGHSLAMQGISAEEIAHILGHSSLVVAKHYILATPALALIRAKALGINPVWKNMIAMMLTGKLISSEKWNGKRVAGIVGGKLHAEVGGCSRADINGECPFTEVRCCYGCLYYRPFSEGDHQSVLDSIIHEVDELLVLSDSVGCGHNPLIAIHETTQLEIQSVITRCMYHKNSGKDQ